MSLRRSPGLGQHKYNAVRIEVDGHKFASKREASHYQELKLFERAGDIHGLKLQPKFWFMHQSGEYLKIRSKGYPNGRRVSYIADFEFVRNNKRVVQDVKGFDTDVSRLKRSMMELFHGIQVEVVK